MHLGIKGLWTCKHMLGPICGGQIQNYSKNRLLLEMNRNYFLNSWPSLLIVSVFCNIFYNINKGLVLWCSKWLSPRLPEHGRSGPTPSDSPVLVGTFASWKINSSRYYRDTGTPLGPMDMLPTVYPVLRVGSIIKESGASWLLCEPSVWVVHEGLFSTDKHIST